MIDEGFKCSRTPFDVLGRLLAAEDSERHTRSIRYQMTGAKFPEYRELATFDFAESPVNEQQIRTLHEGDSMIIDTDDIVSRITPSFASVCQQMPSRIGQSYREMRCFLMPSGESKTFS